MALYIDFASKCGRRVLILGDGLEKPSMGRHPYDLSLDSPTSPCRPTRACFSGWGCTFGGLVGLTLARNYAELSVPFGGASPSLIAELLRQFIAAETGADPNEITQETRVPQGLNIY